MDSASSTSLRSVEISPAGSLTPTRLFLLPVGVRRLRIHFFIFIILPPAENHGGERWIRTIEGISQQIYSLPHLATLESPRAALCVIFKNFFYIKKPSGPRTAQERCPYKDSRFFTSFSPLVKNLRTTADSRKERGGRLVSPSGGTSRFVRLLSTHYSRLFTIFHLW